MKVNMINDSGMDVSEDLLNKWIKGIAAELTKKKVLSSEKKSLEVSLVFLNENDAKKLNWNYRCKDYPTDILSFNSDDPTSMGELVLCPQVISRQAKEHGLSLDDELGYIVLHGVLHLLGYDHEKNKVEEERMMALQDDVFETLRNPKKGKVKTEAPPAKKNFTVKQASAVKPVSGKASPGKEAKTKASAPKATMAKAVKTKKAEPKSNTKSKVAKKKKK